MIWILVPIMIAMLAAPSEQFIENKHTWDNQHPGSAFKLAFKSINEYLMNEVDDRETMPVNLDALRARLDAGERAPATGKVLRKLIALKDTQGKCDATSYDILKDNDEATDHKSHDITSKSSAPRRIDKLVNFYATQHAETCQPMTVAAFEKDIVALDKQVLERISTYLDPIVERLQADTTNPDSKPFSKNDVSNKLFHGLITKKYLNHAIIEDVPHAYNTIMKMVKNNPSEETRAHFCQNEKTGFRGFFADKFSELVVKYIEKPCLDYVSYFGDLFENASFDAIFHHRVDSNNIKFYQAWAHEKVCMDIVKSKWKREFRRDITHHAYLVAEREEAS